MVKKITIPATVYGAPSPSDFQDMDELIREVKPEISENEAKAIRERVKLAAQRWNGKLTEGKKIFENDSKSRENIKRILEDIFARDLGPITLDVRNYDKEGEIEVFDYVIAKPRIETDIPKKA